MRLFIFLCLASCCLALTTLSVGETSGGAIIGSETYAFLLDGDSVVRVFPKSVSGPPVANIIEYNVFWGIWIIGGKAPMALSHFNSSSVTSLEYIPYRSVDTMFTEVTTLASGLGITIISGKSTLYDFAYSDDGSVWTPVAGQLFGGQGASSMVFSNTGLFWLACGVRKTGGNVTTSALARSNGSNGRTWIDVPFNLFSQVYDVATGNGFFVVVGRAVGNELHNVATSTDGQTWVGRGLVLSTAVRAVSFSRRENRFMIVGEGIGRANVASSFDNGQTWQIIGSDLINEASSVQYSSSENRWMVGTKNAAYGFFFLDSRTNQWRPVDGSLQFRPISFSNDDRSFVISGVFNVDREMKVAGNVRIEDNTVINMVAPDAKIICTGAITIGAGTTLNVAVYRAGRITLFSAPNNITGAFTRIGSQSACGNPLAAANVVLPGSINLDANTSACSELSTFAIFAIVFGSIIVLFVIVVGLFVLIHGVIEQSYQPPVERLSMYQPVVGHISDDL